MTTQTDHCHVCSHRISFILDNVVRKLFQNPQKILAGHIRPGDTVIDIGCGPGFFTLEMARMAGPKGRVTAVDLQAGMLEKMESKARRAGLWERITPHQCGRNRLGLDPELAADFALAFYMVHETPDPVSFLSQTRALLRPGGTLLVVEPFFHVSKKDFEAMARGAQSVGFTIKDRPRGNGGPSLLLAAPA